MNEQIYQPTIGQGNEAEIVADVSDRQNAYADVARVAIADPYVASYIHSGRGSTSTAAGWRDPVVNEWVMQYGIATGFTAGRVFRTGHEVEWPHQGLACKNQVLAPCRRAHGDSGAPVFMHRNGWDEVDILRIHVSHILYAGQRQAIFSPISGVMHELPGWYPYTR
ncbi:S1 family peptidase [Dehalococcoidia bacterium]|nr:S1 family peptidase [Dehalococcoidia bacterium]